jgi:hypothetical protein
MLLVCGEKIKAWHSSGMPSEKWQIGDKDVDENITLR